MTRILARNKWKIIAYTTVDEQVIERKQKRRNYLNYNLVSKTFLPYN